MSKLPNSERAFVDPLKLTDYVLNSSHRTGRHKSRVFAAALGLNSSHAMILAEKLTQAAVTQTAEFLRTDVYGAHYAVEFNMVFQERTARIRSLWLIREGEEFPRLVTAFVAREEE